MSARKSFEKRLASLLLSVQPHGSNHICGNDLLVSCSGAPLSQKETPFSEVMEEEIKRWTARRRSALVFEIIQFKAPVAAASRQSDLTPEEIASWVEYGRRAWRTRCLQGGPVPRMGRQGWLAQLGFGDRLQHASSARLAPVTGRAGS